MKEKTFYSTLNLFNSDNHLGQLLSGAVAAFKASFPAGFGYFFSFRFVREVFFGFFE